LGAARLHDVALAENVVDLEADFGNQGEGSVRVEGRRRARDGEANFDEDGFEAAAALRDAQGVGGRRGGGTRRGGDGLGFSAAAVKQRGVRLWVRGLLVSAAVSGGAVAAREFLDVHGSC
jgi:hypothetical protein